MNKESFSYNACLDEEGKNKESKSHKTWVKVYTDYGYGVVDS